MNGNEATLVYADEYSRVAEAYDRVVVPRFEPIARAVVELVDPKPNELVLDLATGTGLLARLLAPLVKPQSVVAIDLADQAISVGSYRAGEAGIHNIRFEIMDARNIVYRGKLFDAVGSNLGIPNLGYDRAFAEVLRVLKPDGRFVFSEWDARLPEGDVAFYELLSKHATTTPSKELATVRQAVRLNRSDPDARALNDPGAVQEKLRAAGFSSTQVVSRTFPARFAGPEDLVSFLTAWGWDEREMAEMPPLSRTAFDAEFAARLSPRLGPEGLIEEFRIHLYVARPE